MVLGMTPGEISLTAFIFLLVYGAAFLPRLGEWIAKLGGGPPRGGADGGAQG